jgi:hypothetical protein
MGAAGGFLGSEHWFQGLADHGAVLHFYAEQFAEP